MEIDRTFASTSQSWWQTTHYRPAAGYQWHSVSGSHGLRLANAAAGFLISDNIFKNR